MKKLIILLMFLTTFAEAKSFKLSDFGFSIFAKNKNECKDNSMCGTGLCVLGKCVFCSSQNPCPTDTKCIMGECVSNPPCRTTADCVKGICDTNNAQCVECIADTDCHLGTAKGSRCVNNVCEYCAQTDLTCGACGESQKPDGSGGCVCADDAFNNSGTCSKLCDSTVCNGSTVPIYDNNASCCCQTCSGGTFPADGVCASVCDYTTCLSGTKRPNGSTCCCG